MKTCTKSERVGLDLTVGKMVSSNTINHKGLIKADAVGIGKYIVPNAHLGHDSERFCYKDHSDLKVEWGGIMFDIVQATFYTDAFLSTDSYSDIPRHPPQVAFIITKQH
jgi:hypothetical protein